MQAINSRIMKRVFQSRGQVRKAFIRALKGGSQPNLLLIVEGGSWSVVDNGGYQSRNAATTHLLAEALKSIDRSYLMRERVISIWTDDFIPSEVLKEGKHFAYCASSPTKNLSVIPDFVFWYWPEVGIFDYRELTKSVVDASQKPCDYDKLFWIGNAAVHPSRGKLMNLGRVLQGAEFVDITWRANQSEYLPSDVRMDTEQGTFVSLPDHCQYRFLIDVEGRGYSGRLKVLLFSNRTLFIQERPWTEFFQKELRPFEHFIPVANSLNDLSEMFDWAVAHPKECREIAENAQRFAMRELTREKAVAYLKNQIVDAITSDG